MLPFFPERDPCFLLPGELWENVADFHRIDTLIVGYYSERLSRSRLLSFRLTFSDFCLMASLG